MQGAVEVAWRSGVFPIEHDEENMLFFMLVTEIQKNQF